MGDRTTVYLTVLSEHARQIEDVYHGSWQEEDADAAPGHITYTFEAVNYGNLEHLDKLQALGVAYDAEWCDGDEYGAGSTYLRFTEAGEVETKTVYDADEDKICLSLVLRAVKQEGQSLAGIEALLLDGIAAQAALPWTNQLELGKRYRTLQLINT